MCEAIQKQHCKQIGVTRSKGGKVTKPIILVKICYKLLYVIQGVLKNCKLEFFIKAAFV